MTCYRDNFFFLQVFDKALDEPNYSRMYAQLCLRLNDFAPIFPEPTNQKSVSAYILIPGTTLPLAVINTCICISIFMVFHAEGLAGIELQYAAQLTVQPVQGFENDSHHFPAAESALHAVDESPADVPSSLPLFLYCYASSLPTYCRLSAGDSIVVPSFLWLHCTVYCVCQHCCTHRKYVAFL